jgi:hypothetical protein
MTAARPARAGGAPGLSAGSGGNLSAGHVLNGEPSGSTRPTVVPPTSAGSTISRRLPAARLRLGMRVGWGGEIVEIVRPDLSTVKRGYGRVYVKFHGGQDWNYYPHDLVVLAADEDAPADPTMDDWPGVWWPTTEVA